jgi:short-subunit dehydrogenase
MSSDKKTKILISGATGSIGRALLSELGATSYNARLLPEASCDHLIIAHGGERGDMYQANVSSLLRMLETIQVRGRTIVFCSRRSLIPTVSELHYSASKAAAYAACRAFYEEGRNITALCPGWVESRMSQEAGASNAIPMGHITKTVRWLLSIPETRVREILLEPAAHKP